MTKSSKFLLFSLLFFLWSCDSKLVFEDDQSFDGKSWHMDNLPEFEFEIDDATPKNITLRFRNDLEYPFQNIYITWFLLDAQGNELESELVNIQLFDEITGKPLGEGNSIYQFSETILENYNFSAEGSYKIRLAQYMRTETLPGTYSVGVRVEESE